MKHPQITEEHAKELWKRQCENWKSTLENLKNNGFIEKSPVEEIKERYMEWSCSTFWCDGGNKDELIKRGSMIHSMYAVILDLEKQIEEMKK